MKKNPWENTPDELPIDLQPFFQNDELFNLTESTIELGNYLFFNLGYVLASVHSFGLIHGDLHKGNVIYQPWNGYVVLIDLGNAKLDVEICATNMIADFIIPFQDFEKKQFISFIAGYLRNAYILLEKEKPGYVQSLLRYIGGNPQNLPVPRKEIINVEAIFNAIDAKIEYSKDNLDFKFDIKKFLCEVDSYPEETFLFIISLNFLGFDAIDRLKQADLSTLENSSAIKLVSFLIDNSNISEYTPKSQLIQAAIDWYMEYREHSQEYGKNINQVNMNAFPILIQKIRNRKLTSPVSQEFLDLLIDVFDYFAALLDTGEKSKYHAISFAQASCILFQEGLENPRHDELRYLTLLKHHEQFSWCKARSVRDKKTLTDLLEVSYFNSKCIALIMLFNLSVSEEHPMYSLFFDALHLYRDIILGFHESLMNTKSETEIQNLELIGKSTIGGYARVFEAYFRACLFDFSSLYFNDKKEITLSDEMEWAVKLFTHLRDGKTLSSPEGKQLLKRITEFIRR